MWPKGWDMKEILTDRAKKVNLGAKNLLTTKNNLCKIGFMQHLK